MSVTEISTLPLDAVKALHDSIIEVANDVAAIKRDMATKDDIAAVKSEIASLRDEMAGEFLNVAEMLGDQAETLRRIEGHLGTQP